jgi:hypothetical protein
VAIAHDAVSNVAAGTGNLSWTHTPTGTPRGVVVLIGQSLGITDEVTGVTYGGVAMTEIALSPLIHDATSGATDDGVLYGYWLGASVPTGAQTVAVTVNGTGSSKRAVAATVTASSDVAVEDTSTFNEVNTTTTPTVTLTTGSGVVTQCYGVLIFGQPGVGDVQPGTGVTTILEHDAGAHVICFGRSTSTDAGSDFTMAWALEGAGTTDDAAILAIAFKESAAAAYTLDCQPGSFTLTGAAATVARQISINAASGTYALTGFATTTVATRVINAATGAFAITGTAATTAAGRLFNAEPGTYTLTGVAATLTQATPGAYVISADPGSYALTGTAATVVSTRVLSADPATYAISGVAASVGRTPELNAQPGSYTLTGVAATFVTTRMISADPGSYAITGTSATLASEGQAPNMDEILTGWIGSAVVGHVGGGRSGRVATPTTGAIA